MAAATPPGGMEQNLAQRFAAFQDHPDTTSQFPAVQTQSPAPETPPAPAVEEEDPPAVEEPEETLEDPLAAEASEEAPTEDSGDSITTLADLAKTYDLDEGEFAGHLRITGPDGESHSLQEAITAFQDGPTETESVARAVQAKVEESRKAMDVEMSRVAQHAEQLLARITVNENIDWKALKESDIHAFVAKQEEHQLDKANVQMALEAMHVEQDRRAKEDEGFAETHRNDQARLLYELMPAWRDKAAAVRATDHIKAYLTQDGYEADVYAGLTDARMIRTVWKAAQYDLAQAKKPEGLKRLKKLPSSNRLAATARSEATAASANKTKGKALLSKFRESGKTADMTDLFREMM